MIKEELSWSIYLPLLGLGKLGRSFWNWSGAEMICWHSDADHPERFSCLHDYHLCLLGQFWVPIKKYLIFIIIYSLRRMLLGVLLVAIWWEFGFSTILILLLLLLLWLMLLRALRLLIGRMRHIWSLIGPLVGLEMLGGGTTMAATMMIMLIALLTTTTTVLLSVILSLWVTTTTLVHHSTTIHMIAATRESVPKVEELPITQKGVRQAFVGDRLWVSCISIDINSYLRGSVVYLSCSLMRASFSL